MASRYMQQFLYSFTPMLTSIHGVINVATSTTGVSSVSMTGATAARTGVGEITITFVDKWNAFMAASFQVLSGTAQDRVVQIKSVDMSTGVIVLNLLAGASPTDPAGSALSIYCNILLRNSSVTK